jgi:CDP-paratose 2-epimerase
MKILITGYAGFIGSRVWSALSERGHNLYGLDDLSRLTAVPREDPKCLIGDVVDIRSIERLDADFDWVIHLAGQVSVVAGEKNPIRDFHTNSYGTFEVVQWAKAHGASVIYSSTNKVFGELAGVDQPILDTQPLMPQTNYGVSKASGAMYVADYPSGWVLHQSCIYGPTQVGELDQGWIGWLRQSIKSDRPITCFGDGSQVRDLLHVDDLINLYMRILDGAIPSGSFAVGGGKDNSVTFQQAVEALGGRISGYEDWRPHDQRYFVSANSGLSRYGWCPLISKDQGLSELV